ncbi:hypothetical protein [Streptomyces sp. NPDC051561]|uniref:hypothetical protein n=1 Tax=Streptomyces sp. NPDC051561 TaxID=3365658 RepID=UPI0037B43F15
MSLPSWDDGKLGGKIRAALWLLTVVGTGNVFTKSELREAFPGESQIDRRVRELRDLGWVIETSRTDSSLKQEEQRFVAMGAEVWIPGKAKAAKHKNSLTAVQRSKVMLADNFLCRTCGIGAGEPYTDGALSGAQLNVARRKVMFEHGAVGYELVTECKRCGSGVEREADLGKLLGQVAGFTDLQKQVLLGWIASDQRKQGELEKFWGVFRTLPAPTREVLRDALSGDDEQS